jgi:hypothetical protein
VDAYIHGDVLPEEAESDAESWNKILEESAANAIEGKELPKRWTEKPSTGAPTTSGASSQDGKEAPVLQNGKNRPPEGSAPAAGRTAPLTPRPVVTGGGNPASVSTENHSLNASTTNPETVVNGLSDRHDTPTVGHLKGAARNDAATLETNADTNRKDAAAKARVRDVERTIQERQAKDAVLDDAEAKRKARHERRMNDIMEQRYKNRSFRDAKDWENLGHLREGETALSKEDYNKRVGELLERAQKMRSAEGRAGMSQDEVRDMLTMFKTVGNVAKGEDGNYTGNLTAAQMDALEKRMNGLEASRDNRRAMTKARIAALDHDNATRYREQYGLDGFSDKDVLDFHKRRVERESNDALNELTSMGPAKTAEDLAKFDKAWDRLRSSTNITAAFDRAMRDPEAKAKYMDTIAGLSPEEREAHRKATILSQLQHEQGTAEQYNRILRNSQSPAETPKVRLGADVDTDTPEGRTAASDAFAEAGIRVPGAMPKGTIEQEPDREVELGAAPSPADALNQLSSTPQATNAWDEAEAALRPRKKKEEGLQQAAKGGVTLLPRRR